MDDAQWCRQQCDTYAIPLTILSCDTDQFARSSGEGIEAAARIERYRLLTAAAEQAGVRYLATAHTLTDQAETVRQTALQEADTGHQAATDQATAEADAARVAAGNWGRSARGEPGPTPGASDCADQCFSQRAWAGCG